jgi:hypothetical protein
MHRVNPSKVKKHEQTLIQVSLSKGFIGPCYTAPPGAPIGRHPRATRRPRFVCFRQKASLSSAGILFDDEDLCVCVRRDVASSHSSAPYWSLTLVQNQKPYIQFGCGTAQSPI